MLRRLLTCFTLWCFVTAQTMALAGPHEEGTAAGQAANPVIRGTVSTPNATANVPGYTRTPAEAAYYGQPSLSGPANARLTACTSTPDDPVCQAQRGALNSANTPRPAISPYDPAVMGARDIAANPSLALGSLSSYYSGCATADVTTPAGAVTKQCQRYNGVGNYATRRDLTVQVELVPSCTAGDWFAHGQANRNGADYMVAEAQCRIRTDQLQQFRFYAAGGNGACIGWQNLELPSTPATQPAFVTDLSPHWGGHCWRPFKVVMMPGSGCSSGQCNYNFQFGTPVYACPTGTVRGDQLQAYWSSRVQSSGPADRCFTLTMPRPRMGCDSGPSVVVSRTEPRCAQDAGAASLVGASGWSIPLSFQQPTMNHIETDVWDDKSAPLEAGGRCTVTTADRCVDGPATKVIDGRAVTRACWSYERTLSCTSGALTDECAPLVSQGCTLGSSTCKQTNAATGMCEVYQDSYTCPAAAQTITTATNCPSNVFCLGDSCFNTSYTNDAEFARSMSMLEAAREAGVYLDTKLMQVFKGEGNHCRDRLFKDCCDSDSAGAGMSNQSTFGVGSRLVYDVLMNSENREFIYQGMSALLTSGGFSGSFTSYGVTVAVNGTALPAGSSVLYAGDSMVVAFDPWSLAIAVVIYIVMSMMSCNEEEGKLAMREGAGLCHATGSWCSSCLRVLGACVSCLEHTTGKCCFNSKLARIVNEQGRMQIGKGWGSGQNPDCSGFTIPQLQSLDFAAMDLTEFYASIVPKNPNLGAIQSGNSAKVPNCYYGQGRCQ
jgi:conjugal transfer mating pair stabilization protein TraN